VNRYLYPIEEGNYIMGVKSFDQKANFTINLVAIANSVTLNPGDNINGYLVPGTMMYFAVNSPIGGFIVQLASTRTSVFLKKNALPNNTSNDLSDFDYISSIRNVTMDPCTGFQPAGKWYIGLYSNIKTQFNLQLFINQESKKFVKKR
jgi:hypothetical protein